MRETQRCEHPLFIQCPEGGSGVVESEIENTEGSVQRGTRAGPRDKTVMRCHRPANQLVQSSEVALVSLFRQIAFKVLKLHPKPLAIA